ncbi:MAG: hypothetical protein ACK5UJ_02860 [Pseudobdellovibrionaceae bacterium]
MKIARSTLDKARAINIEPKYYGAFAEIGAGQEVARFFFMAGKASQTIAKTMSAYDMIYSDEIYGKEKSGRYVCESRLHKMLDKEFQLLIRRLDPSRGDKTQFFAYANTVSTGDGAKKVSHGWMGVRFQTSPRGAPNDLVIHVRLLDKYRLQQQEVLGILGVNLVACAFENMNHPQRIVDALTENLKPGQVSIDFLKITGPDTTEIDNTQLGIELVRKNWAECVLFAPNTQIESVSEAVFDKSVIVDRGQFKPITNSHLALLETAKGQVQKDFGKDQLKDTLEICEIVINQPHKKEQLKDDDLVHRVRSINLAGKHAMISNFYYFYRLKNYVRQASKRPLALIMSIQHIDRLFDEKSYADLEGGLLEGLGKLLDRDTHLYLYPNYENDECLSVSTYQPHKSVKHIYEHFLNSGLLKDMAQCAEIKNFIHSTQIEEWIKERKTDWEKHVPPAVRDFIKKDAFWGFKSERAKTR